MADQSSFPNKGIRPASAPKKKGKFTEGEEDANSRAVRIKNIRNALVPEETPASPPPPTPDTANGIVATNLITGVQGLNVTITVTGQILQSIVLTNISHWTVDGNHLIINSIDSDPITITFINSVEAKLASDRLTSAVNGNII